MKIKLIYFTLFIQILLSETYKDRIRIYIHNSITNFKIDDSSTLSNNDELNRFFIDHKVNKIEQWLPNARPTDRDGDIYLNTSSTDEPLVRGNTLKELMEKLIDAINAQIFSTPAGPTAVGPNNRGDFNKIKSELNTFLSTLNYTE